MSIARAIGMTRSGVSRVVNHPDNQAHIEALMGARDKAMVEASTAIDLMRLGVDIRRSGRN